jgi:hypothetical protein
MAFYFNIMELALQPFPALQIPKLWNAKLFTKKFYQKAKALEEGLGLIYLTQFITLTA